MLHQRVATAVLMAALFLGAVAFLPLPALAAAFGLVAAAGAWEWSSLAGATNPFQRGFFAVLLIAGMVGLWFWCGLGSQPTRQAVQPFIGAAGLLWSLATLWVESYPRGTVWWRHWLIRSLLGWLILLFAWLSVIYLLTRENGAALVILMVILVAAADIGAFFTGQSFGRHKLAPTVSPGKTWEGLWGGLACVAAVVVLVWLNLPNSYSHLRIESLLLVGLATAGASVLGDLTFSMVKRGSGVKDSGSLLPGHGGLLDRLDSVCGAAPVYTLALMLVGY